MKSRLSNGFALYTRLPVALATRALVVGMCLVGSAASAQTNTSPPSQTTPPPQMTPSPDSHPVPMQPPGVPGPRASAPMGAPMTMRPPSPEDVKRMLDLQISMVKNGLKLTPEQEPLWEPAEAAVRELVKTSGEVSNDRRTHPKSDPFETFKQQAEDTVARGALLEKTVAALQPLYDSLSADQKQYLRQMVQPPKPKPSSDSKVGGAPSGISPSFKKSEESLPPGASMTPPPPKDVGPTTLPK